MARAHRAGQPDCDYDNGFEDTEISPELARLLVPPRIGALYSHYLRCDACQPFTRRLPTDAVCVESGVRISSEVSRSATLSNR